jgi:hypothetical protein
MENLIDKNYFWGGKHLPNMEEEQELNDLDRYIAVKQKDYLIRMFGRDIADNMPDKLIALVRDEELLISTIANYVYFHHNRDSATFTTMAGEKGITIRNTWRASPNEKLVAAWNEMVDLNTEIHRMLYAKEIEIEGIDYEADILPNIKLTDDIFAHINNFNI